MPDVYKEEKEKIKKVGIILNNKWKYLTDYRLDLNFPKSKKNVELMEGWATEAANRYREIGFRAIVDITPAMAGISPPTIELEKLSTELTDHERIQYEVLKEEKEKGNL